VGQQADPRRESGEESQVAVLLARSSPLPLVGGVEKALKAFQEANGLVVDGIAGPDTFAAMGLHELVLLRKGSRGAQVKKLQTGLGIDADGKFGPGTEKAVKDFQAANGLTADGMAGPNTLAKMSTFAAEVTPEVIQGLVLSQAVSKIWKALPLVWQGFFVFVRCADL